MAMLSNKWTAAIVILATAIALAVTLRTSYDLRRISQCQAEATATFQMNLKARTDLADGDREATRTLWREIAKAQPLKSEAGAARVRKAVAEYLSKQAQLDKLRNNFPDRKSVV